MILNVRTSHQSSCHLYFLKEDDGLHDTHGNGASRQDVGHVEKVGS